MENNWDYYLFSVVIFNFDLFCGFFFLSYSGYKLSIHTVCYTKCIWLHVDAVKCFPFRALYKFCQSVALYSQFWHCSCSFRIIYNWISSLFESLMFFFSSRIWNMPPSVLFLHCLDMIDADKRGKWSNY